ncbi:LPXTG cell wall anchor domain-containing protein [Paenibacillus sp. DYY-L-2]
MGLSFTILGVIGLVSFGLAVVFFRKRDLPL